MNFDDFILKFTNISLSFKKSFKFLRDSQKGTVCEDANVIDNDIRTMIYAILQI